MKIRALLTLTVLVVFGCSGEATTTTEDTTTTEVSTTAEPTTETTTTTEATTTTESTTTTEATTTTAGDTTPPAKPANIYVRMGGGSGEVVVSWDPNSESDLHHYNVYFSYESGDTKTLRTTVDAGSVWQSGETQPGFIDFPVDQTNGKSCYEIVAVDSAGNRSAPSSEACFYEPPVVVP